jgi:outer membrane protein assembly factor BamB
MPNKPLDDLLYRSERYARLRNGHVFAYTTSDQLVCVDCDARRLVWKFTAPSGCVLSGNAFLGGALYVACSNGELYALDETNGKALWSLSYGDNLGVPVVVGEQPRYAPRLTGQEANPWLQDAPKASGLWRRILDGVFGAQPTPAASTWDQTLSRLGKRAEPEGDPYRSATHPEEQRPKSDARLFLFDSLGLKELSPFDGAVLRRRGFDWESPLVAAHGESLCVLDLSEAAFWALDVVSWQEQWARSFDIISTRGPLWVLGEKLALTTERALHAFSMEDGRPIWRAEVLARELVTHEEDPSLAWLLTDDDLLCALDTRTGATAQLATTRGALGLASYQKQLFIYLPDAIEVFDAMTGDDLRRLSLPGEALGGISVADGQIFLSRLEDGVRSLYSLSLRDDRFSLWKAPV